MNRTVTQLRRYPVKAMGGESLQRIEVDQRGLVGDRQYAVWDADGRLVTGKNSKRFRRRDEIFEFHAETDGDRVRIHRGSEHWDATDPELDTRLAEIMDAPVSIAAEATEPHFDSGSVSLIGSATLRWWQEHHGIDADARRLRVNILVDTTEPFEEDNWIGSELSIGSTRFVVTERVPRCRMIDVAQDGAAAEQRWLKVLTQQRDMCTAIYLDVLTPGAIALGDTVRMETRA